MMLFDGKVAIVTGAGQGIGREVARMLVELGAIVVINDIDVGLVKLAGSVIAGKGRAAPFVADVTKTDQVEKLVDYTVSSFSHVDILVNNVGGVHTAARTLEETSLEYWHQIVDLNLTSQFICCKAVAPVMKKQRYGRIVNVTSAAGVRGCIRDAVSYCAAKAGVIGLTRQLAIQLGGTGITVNAIAPGDVMTETSHRSIEQGLWPETEAELRARHAGYPLGRPAEAREVASCILFLASEEASFITGETMIVTGGNYMHCGS